MIHAAAIPKLIDELDDDMGNIVADIHSASGNGSKGGGSSEGIQERDYPSISSITTKLMNIVNDLQDSQELQVVNSTGATQSDNDNSLTVMGE